MTVVGIGLNPFSRRVPAALEAAAAALGVPARVVDLATLHCSVAGDGSRTVRDEQGPVEVSHLAPALLYWQEAAATAYALLEVQGALVVNSVGASEVADDKSRTAVALSARGVPQVVSVVVPQNRALCAAEAERIGFPVVLKRTHGAQGRWVRAADNQIELTQILQLFAEEGRGALIIQPLIASAEGVSLRLIVIDERVVACTRRRAAEGELQSNISAGGTQRPHSPTNEETEAAVAATRAVRLRFAGVDIIQGQDGPLVLEVNAAPDFTSMKEYVPVDIAQELLEALLQSEA